jgi:hypothetical protein
LKDIIDRIRARFWQRERAQLDALTKSMKDEAFMLRARIRGLTTEMLGECEKMAASDKILDDIRLRNCELKAIGRALLLLDDATKDVATGDAREIRSSWIERLRAEVDLPLSTCELYLRRIKDLLWLVENDGRGLAWAS